MVPDHFGKHTFLTAFDLFLAPKWPIFMAFATLEGPKRAQIGLTKDSFHLFMHPK